MKCIVCGGKLILDQGYIYAHLEGSEDEKERHEMYCPVCGIKYFIGLDKKEAQEAFKNRFEQ